MRELGLLVALEAVVLCVSAVWTPVGVPAAETAAAGPAPQAPLAQALSSVQWAGPSVTLEALRGKSALVLVYATWCPKCNVWSGDLFAQLKQAAWAKPVVVLAVNADDSPASAQRYLTERGFFAPNIFHGYDPSITQRLGFQSNLFQYVLVGPDGSVAGRGQAGAFYQTPQGQQFALAADLAKNNHLGELDFITPEMSDEVKLLFWPWELGGGSETALRSVQKKLRPEQREEVDAAVNRYLDARIERIRGLYKGTVEERFEAYETAVALSGTFKNAEQSQKAKQVVAYMEKDEQFNRELGAKKAYDGAMARATGQPGREARYLRSVAKRFADTHYGKLAEAAVASAERQ